MHNFLVTLSEILALVYFSGWPLKIHQFFLFFKIYFFRKKYTRFFPKTKFTLVDRKWTIKVHKNQLIFLKMVGPFLYTNLSCVQLWTQLVQESGSFSSPIGEENDPFFYTSWVQSSTLGDLWVHFGSLACQFKLMDLYCWCSFMVPKQYFSWFTILHLVFLKSPCYLLKSKWDH